MIARGRARELRVLATTCKQVDVTRANGQTEVDQATDDELPDVDDEPSFVNPHNVSVEVTVGDSSDVSTLAAEQAADETLKVAFIGVRLDNLARSFFRRICDPADCLNYLLPN